METRADIGSRRNNVGQSDLQHSRPMESNTVRDPAVRNSTGDNLGQSDLQNTRFVDNDVYDGDNDLLAYIRKKPKRFYIGGFKPGITEDMIYRYVKLRGPMPTMVRIFPMRKRYGVVIRLNVEDDESAHLVGTPQFWPRKVVCRPWLSRAQFVSSTYNRRYNDRNEHQSTDEPNYGSYNRYNELSSSYNVD